MFLRVEGKKTGVVKGESTVPEHPEEIEIFGWEWSISGSQALGGAGGGVKTALDELRLRKRADASSTQLMSLMRSNEPIKQAVLTVRKAGVNPPVDYLTITVKNGRITDFRIGTDSDDSPSVVESLKIAFEEIEVQYAPQTSTGSKGAVLAFSAMVNT